MVTRVGHLSRVFCRLGLVALVTSCSDQRSLTAPSDPTTPVQEIMDGGHSSGNPHFYFLPPLVSKPDFSGEFDGSVSPVVEICEWNGSRCTGPLIARFTTTTGPGSETVRASGPEGLYIVNWHTGQFDLDVTRTYRIRVLVSYTEVGHADVDVVGKGGELKNVQTGEFIPLLDGRTVPIKFRIEAGVLGPAVVAMTLTPLVADVTSMSGSASFAVVGSVPHVALACTINGEQVPCDQPLSWSGRGLAHGDQLIIEVSATDLDQTPALPGPTAHVEAIIDDQAPVIVIQKPLPGLTVGPNHSVLFSLDDAAATFTCQLDALPLACQPGVEQAVGPLFTGPYQLDIAALDPVGNQASAVSQYFVDGTPPIWDPSQLFVPSSPVGPSSTPETVIRFRAQDPEHSIPIAYECSLDGGAFGTCSTTSPLAGMFEWSGLAGGDHQVTIVAYDRVENAGVPLEVTFVVDASLP